MERVKITAAPREEIGKSAAQHLRAQGLVPAVLYGRGREPLALKVDEKEMKATLAGGTYSTHIFDLQVAGGPKAPVAVMIKEVQRNPISRVLQNIDFHAISLTEKVHAQVPVVFTGEPAGLRQGGILERLHSEISVSCLPTKIPERIEVDISGMMIGDSIHARGLAIPAEVELLTSLEEVLVVLAPPAKVVEEVPAAAAEAAAEPEVIGQKGEETSAEEPEEKKEKKK
jgi:large subunit ribosomal protein L25